MVLLLLAALALPAHAAPKSSVKAPTPAQPAEDPWSVMIAKATPAIVSIDILSTRSFDTENAAHAYATGFVVDAERGIILTNRHVVTPGPVRSEAITQGNEVIPLRAIYRDPVHDFGFYQYDPALLKYAKLPALELDPTGAKVGLEIRVMGNNAGEKLSIHTGTIARLDRDAPRYGRDGFNDFNTFYLQAAAGTTGGSSGSPVLDLRGKVVALNAGARRDSAASFYFPLDRVARALQLIQQGKPVTRGSLQTVFGLTAWDELDRLGLSAEDEAAARARHPDGTGLLVVREVLPDGPADGVLQVGDILLSLDGEPIDAFLPLESVLDDRVGGVVKLGVSRAGRPVQLTIGVRDMHADTPDRYLELGGDVLHDLSFQQARNHHVAVKGVYVAAANYSLRQAGVPEGARIDSVAQMPTPDLSAFEAVISKIPGGVRVPVRYVELDEPNRVQVAAIRFERSLFPARECVRDDHSGRWPCTDLPAAPAGSPPVAGVVPLPSPPPGPPGKVANALVWVEARLPFVLSGNEGDAYSGVGLVIDKAKGLVLVDRDTVPQSLAEVSVIVGGAFRVPAKAVYFHPEHNLAVIQFDPGLLAGTALGEARIAKQRALSGSKVWQVGLNGRLEYTTSETSVEGYRPFVLNAPKVPQYRDENLDLMSTTAGPLERGGVVVNRAGEVVAFLGSFVSGSGQSQSAAFRGLPGDIVAEVTEALVAGTAPPNKVLGVAWAPLSMAGASDRGLSLAEAAIFSKAKITRVLTATHISPANGAHGKVIEGDMLLAVNGHATSSWRDLELATAAGAVKLRLWRGDSAVEVEVPASTAPTADLDRAMVWAGALIQDPSPILALQQGTSPVGVYVSWRWFGSPADRYDLDPTWRIVAVDEAPVHSLAEFEKAVAGRPDGAALRLDVLDLDDRPHVITLKLDLDYWPAAELRRTPEGWTRVALP